MHEAEELKKLFPQSFKRTIQFDPMSNLEGLPDKKKKKKGSTSSGRTLKLTVCRLRKLSTIIPRGKARTLLKSDGRIVDVFIARAMSAQMVKDIINRAFHGLEHSTEWKLLETGQDNQLEVAINQAPDGNVICSRRGCIYIVDDEVCTI